MNISPISYNSVNLNNVHKINQNISFCGGKTALAENAVEKTIDKKIDNVGCAVLTLGGLLLAPIVMFLGTITSINGKHNMDFKLLEMKDEYSSNITLGDYSLFNEKFEKIKDVLNKHSKNEEYSKFVIDALEFLRVNFEQNQDETGNRMKPFENEEGFYDYNFEHFMRTVRAAADAAVSKNKTVNEKNIQFAREIMQKAE